MRNTPSVCRGPFTMVFVTSCSDYTGVVAKKEQKREDGTGWRR